MCRILNSYVEFEFSTIYTCTVHLHENTAYKQQECKTVSAAWVVFSHYVGTGRFLRRENTPVQHEAFARVLCTLSSADALCKYICTNSCAQNRRILKKNGYGFFVFFCMSSSVEIWF